jgi:hypothetical protein
MTQVNRVSYFPRDLAQIDLGGSRTLAADPALQRETLRWSATRLLLGPGGCIAHSNVGSRPGSP